jgi:hypothetical protein
MQYELELQRRIRRLERFVLLLCVVVAVCWIAAANRPDAPDGWLRTRGLIIEDAQGRPRIVIAAPVSTLEGRTRTDEAVGMVVLSPEGGDIFQIGRVGGPQMGGKVQPRMSPATGLMFADARGNERGGMGVFDNGQAGWGLDYDGHEGLVALVDPERKLAGMVLQSMGEGDTQRMSILTTSTGTTFELRDGSAKPRVRIEVPAEGEPRLQVLDAKGEPSFDAASKR